MQGEARYVLYVGQDHRDRTRFCPGSRAALDIVDSADLATEVNVQPVSQLLEQMKTLPWYLTGTPTLVSLETRKAMRGTGAIEHLRELASGAAEAAAEPSPSDEIQGVPAASALESNFEPLQGGPEDAAKYSDDHKVSEQDVQRLLQRRNAALG